VSHILYERNFLTTPYGAGWLLNCERFDQIIKMRPNTLVATIFWQALRATDNQPVAFYPKTIIDATGRSRSMARPVYV